MKDKLTEDQEKVLRDLKDSYQGRPQTFLTEGNRQYPMREDECYPPPLDKIDQPVLHSDVDKPVYIEYYAHGKMVGHNMIPKGSNQADRETYAENVNVEFFDEFRLDNGRVIAQCFGRKGFVDDHGRIWNVINIP